MFTYRAESGANLSGRKVLYLTLSRAHWPPRVRIWPARLYLTVDGTVELIDWLSFKVKVKRPWYMVAFAAWTLVSAG